jgi:hypothetical protein
MWIVGREGCGMLMALIIDEVVGGMCVL